MAAITVPTLVADWQKQATVAGLKKAYSTLSNAYTRSIADNGPQVLLEMENDTRSIFRNIFLPYLNVAVDCKVNSEREKSCSYKYKENRNSEEINFLHPLLILNDGMVVAPYYILHTRDSKGKIRILAFGMIVDINGHKKPNRLGRDMFYIYLDGRSPNNPKLTMQDVIDPVFGRAKTREERIQLCKQEGTTCGQLIMDDGWQIKSDYPW